MSKQFVVGGCIRDVYQGLCVPCIAFISLSLSAKLVTLLSLELELRRTFHLIHGLYTIFAKGVMNLYTGDAPPPTPSKVKDKKKRKLIISKILATIYILIWVPS